MKYVLFAFFALLAACRERPTENSPPSAAAGTEWLVERATVVGLDFLHFNGTTGEYYDAEIFPPGVAIFDYDNDGDLDLYVVQGQMLDPTKTIEQAQFPYQGPMPPKDRLYRNDLFVAADGLRTLRFTDVTNASGIDVRSYGMGVAAGDFDNDGRTDLYLTRLGPNVLLRNNGNGTFSDVSQRSGTDDPSWSVSAAWIDIDRDGWLDLYVGNYLRYTIEGDADCFSPSGEPDYCDPTVYQPARDRLYRNQRDGTFRDITNSALRGGHGPALGVSTADFNGDGWMDVYVANDRRENDLWINQRDGTFRNDALVAGAALNIDGRAEASMGVDAGDFDNDGDDDLFMTNFTAEGSTLFRNDGSARFDDVGVPSGLRPRSVPYTGFGTAWFDIDNDGLLDLLSVNGTVKRLESLAQKRDPFPFGQSRQLFRNLGNNRFEDITSRAESALRPLEVGRGAAFGDVDNDGDADVVVANNNGPLRLLINQIGNQGHWLGLRLVGASASRDMLGARVAVERADGSTLWRRVRSDGSYASANDPRVLVGLGDATSIRSVRVVWPNGQVETWTGLPIDRWMTVKEGTGR